MSVQAILVKMAEFAPTGMETTCIPVIVMMGGKIQIVKQVSTIEHYCDVIMGAMSSQITSFTIVYSKLSKLRVTGLCAGTSPVTGEFPAQMASNAENVSIWWRRHSVWLTRYHLSNVRTFLALFFPRGILSVLSSSIGSIYP